MTRTNVVRLNVEEMEGRTTPAVLSAVPDVGFSQSTAQAEDVPQHVSLAAAVVIALAVGWDHRTRTHVKHPTAVR